MKSALLRFAPVFTPRLVDDAKLVREYMVERGALVPLSYQKPIPVLVNHDESRQIGTVRTLAIYDDVLSGTLVAPYYFAHVDITGATAMRRGDGVSWGFHRLHELEIAGTKLIRRALILEVSVLTPAVKPAEAFARVMWVGEKQTSSPVAVPTSDRAVAGEPSDAYRPRLWDELERAVGYRITDANWERALTQARPTSIERLYAEVMAAKRTEPQVITRHGVGQVLGVR